MSRLPMTVKKEGGIKTPLGVVLRRPLPPVIVSLVASGASATLTWRPPVLASGDAPITEFRVARDGVDSNGSGAYNTIVPLGQTSFTFLSLITGTYNLTVTALSAGGESAVASRSVVINAAPAAEQPAAALALFPYAADSVWKLGRAEAAEFEAAADPRTANLLANGAPGDGKVWVNDADFSHHMEFAAESDPMRIVTDRSDSTRTASWRIPLAARPSVGSDAHLHTLQPDGVTLREAFAMQITNAGTAGATYSSGRNATSLLNGSGIGPQAGTRAYGGGAMAGLIRIHEVDPSSPHFAADPRYPGQNVPLIRHPLAFALREEQLFQAGGEFGYFFDDLPLDAAVYPGHAPGRSRRGFMKQRGYIWPATEQDYDSISGFGHYLGKVPMGAYLSIPSATARPAVSNLAALTPTEKATLAVFHAAQDYGSYVTDRSGAMSLYVEHTVGGAGPAATFSELLRGGASFSAAPLRSVVSLLRIVKSNDHARPNGGAPNAPRRGTSSAPPPPPVSSTGRAKVGVYTGYQTSDADRNAYEAFLGRPVDYVLEFQGTESTQNLSWPNYMRDYYTRTRMGTRRLMLGATLSPTKVTSGNFYDRVQTWQQLADGLFDGVWAEMARQLVATGQGDCVLRGAHEFNEPMFAHRVVSAAEIPPFIAAWRRWHGIVRANGFTGKIHWNPTTGDYNGNNLDTFAAYPGDAFVDVIDLDLYDRWYTRGSSPTAPRTLAEQQAKWDQHLNMDVPTWRGLKACRAFAVARGKGMAFSEWGLGSYFNQPDGNHGGGDNDYFVNKMADFILDPAFPPGSPGGVLDHAFWEDGNTGVRPLSPTNPDVGRAIPVPKARAAFLARFGGPATPLPPAVNLERAPALPTLAAGAQLPATDWSIVDFADDFDDPAVTAQKWNLNRDAFHPTTGWYAEGAAANQTPPPVTQIEVKDSTCWLYMRRLPNPLGKAFTSALMTTGRPNQTAGTQPKYVIPENSTTYTEARLFCERKRGSWAAFWLLGDTYTSDANDVFGNPKQNTTYVQHWDGQTATSVSNGWPTGGEVDILEFPENNVGDSSKPFVSLHWARDDNPDLVPPKPGSWLYREFMGHPDSYKAARPELQDSWHTWGCYRSPLLMVFFIDGVELCRFHRFEGGTATAPASSGPRRAYTAWDGPHVPAPVLWTKPQYLFLNYSVGVPGTDSWSGQGWTSTDQYEEGKMGIGYVKVWRKA